MGGTNETSPPRPNLMRLVDDNDGVRSQVRLGKKLSKQHSILR
jgi:hypothetical protein